MTSRGEEAETLNDSQVVSEKSELLEIFFFPYDWRLPAELTLSDQTLTLVARAHRLKSIEFNPTPPLSRVASLADAKDVHVEHIRIKGTNGDLLLGPSKSLTRGNSDFNRSPGEFLFAVKLLMRTYVLVSRNDERDAMWCRYNQRCAA